MKKPAFLIASEDTTPELLKYTARQALSAYLQAVADTTPIDHDPDPDQHEQ